MLASAEERGDGERQFIIVWYMAKFTGDVSRESMVEASLHLFAVESIEGGNGGGPHTPDRGTSQLLGCYVLQHSLGSLKSRRRSGGGEEGRRGGDTDGRMVVSESAQETRGEKLGQDCDCLGTLPGGGQYCLAMM